MATEVALLPLRNGKDLNDTNGEASKVLQKIFETLRQQRGFQRAYWRVEHENSNSLGFFVDWDSIEDHMEFKKKEYVKTKGLPNSCSLTRFS